jgi:nucleoside-diphosphate-sugar epimerase
METIIITGSNGFIGSSLVDALSKRAKEIYG